VTNTPDDECHRDDDPDRAIRTPSRTEGNVPSAPGGLRGPPPSERPRPEGRRTTHGVRVTPGPGTVDDDPRTAVISAVVDHEPGVLSNVTGLFSRRQFNIESLTVGPTADDDYARVTIVVEEPTPGVEQVKKQLRRLVTVHEVRELADSAVEREMALIEVSADRPDAVQTAVDQYEGEVVDASPDTVTVAVTGPKDRVDDAVETFAGFGLREVARTGATALARGETPTTEWAPSATADDATTTGDSTTTDRTTQRIHTNDD